MTLFLLSFAYIIVSNLALPSISLNFSGQGGNMLDPNSLHRRALEPRLTSSKATPEEVKELLSQVQKDFSPWRGPGISLDMVERLYCINLESKTMLWTWKGQTRVQVLQLQTKIWIAIALLGVDVAMWSLESDLGFHVCQSAISQSHRWAVSCIQTFLMASF